MSALPADRPLPTIQGEARPFWEGCARHELLLQKCSSCGKLQFYPRAICHHCWSDAIEWVPASGRGTIYTYTVVHRPPAKSFQALVPYVVALIELDEGVRMLSHVVGVAPEDVAIDQPVRVAFDDVDEGVSLPVFEPA